MYPEWPYRELLDMPGQWSAPDAPDVPLEQGALVARNCEFFNGQVSKRHGFARCGSSGNLTAAVTAMHGWIGGGIGNYIVYATSGTGNAVVVLVSTPATATSASVVGGSPFSMVFASLGSRLFAAPFSSSQASTGNGGVIYKDGASFGTTPLFMQPIGTAFGAFSEPAGGVVTAGLHNVGYLLEYKSGFTTRPSPDSSTAAIPDTTTFTPYAVTAAGAKNLSLPLSLTGTNIAYVSIIMTPVDSPTQYYVVPGSRTAFGSGTLTFVVNISDDDLKATAEDATPYLFLYTRSGNGTVDPLNPTSVIPFGDRMTYITTVPDNVGNSVSAVYVSDRGKHQAITKDQHIIQLPGQIGITTALPMRGNYYIVGPHWTYVTSDNNQVPVQWPTPKLVDGRRGTPSIRGIDASPNGDYAWIADTDGLYLFTGVYDALPASYLQTDWWRRINWSAAATIIVKDHPGDKTVYVLVPLDGATTPSHLFAFDYTNGKTFTDVKFSYWDLASYPLGAIGIVQNDLPTQATGNAGLLDLWLGSSSSNPILRKMTDRDTTPYRDYGAGGTNQAINWQYQTALFPGKGAQNGILHFHGFHARLKGSATVTPIVKKMDNAASFTCAAQTITTAPGKEYRFLADLRDEGASVLITNNVVDEYAILSSLKMYYSNWITTR